MTKYLLILLLVSTSFGITGRFNYQDGSFLQPNDVLSMFDICGLECIAEISDVWPSYYIMDSDFITGSYFTAYDISCDTLYPVDVLYEYGDVVHLQAIPEPCTLILLGFGILIPKFFRRNKF